MHQEVQTERDSGPDENILCHNAGDRYLQQRASQLTQGVLHCTDISMACQECAPSETGQKKETPTVTLLTTLMAGWCRARLGVQHNLL